MYILELHYIKGIRHLICDVLSRQTINMHTLREDYEFLGEAQTINTAEAVRLNTEVNRDPLVVALALEGASDPSYNEMISALKDRVPFNSLPQPHPLCDYKNEYTYLGILATEGGDLVVFQHNRIIPPLASRPKLLDKLHGPDHVLSIRMYKEG